MGILEQVQDFISKYFIEETGYNPINTIVYSIIGIGLIILILRVIDAVNTMGQKRWPGYHIEIIPDQPFWLALTPYIILGSALRALNDSAVFSTRLLETPLIFFVLIVFALLSLVLSYVIGAYTKRDWRWIFGGIAAVLLLFSLIRIILLIENLKGGLQVIGLTGLWVLGIFAARYFVGTRYLSKQNIAGLTTQMFDASATYVALTFYNYSEKHVLPSFLFGQFGEWVFFPVKFILIFAALISLDWGVEDESFRRWLKLTIYLFGLATGTRDILVLMMGV